MKGEGVPENEIEQDAFSLSRFDYLSGASVALLLNLLVLCSSAFLQKLHQMYLHVPLDESPRARQGCPCYLLYWEVVAILLLNLE